MIVGGVCFYEDEPWLLERSVESIARTGAVAIMAVDGAYAAFPGGSNTSSPECHAALTGACADHDIDLMIHVPNSVWAGNEVEKRQAMIDLIRETERDDEPVWMLVHDTDYVITSCPDDLVIGLTNHRAVDLFASARFYEHFDTDGKRIDVPFVQEIRCLARVTPDLRMSTNHYTYVRNGRGWPVTWQIVGRGGSFIPGFELEHRHDERDPSRRDAQAAYYEVRDREGLEF